MAARITKSGGSRASRTALAAPKPSVAASVIDIEVTKAGEGAAFSGSDAPLTASLGADDEELKFCERAGAIPPPHSLEYLARLCEASTAMAPVLGAIATNCDGHGHQLESVFGAALADDEIETAMLFTREASFDFRSPSKEEVKDQRKRIEHAMRMEKLRLQGVLSACCPGPTNSLVIVRKKRRKDILGLGNGFLEVVRCADHTFGEVNHLRAANMRLRPVLPDPVEVSVVRRLSPLVLERTTRRAWFRTFVQFGPTGRNVFFKEYGDPRAIAMNDGKVYESEEEIRAKGYRPATEVIWSSTNGLSARTAYGVADWQAADAVLVGLRQAQVVNADHFSEKAIPQLVVLVNGAAATAKMVATIKEHFRQLKGAQNYHRVLILSATPPPGMTGQVSIDIRPLRAAIPDDALFQKYEQNCAQTIRSQFRIAKLLLGLGEDVNRATADAVLRFSEEQVFGPMRNEFDDLMNAILLDEGFRYWKFKSNSPIAGNPLDASQLMMDAAQAGAVSVNQILEMQSAIDNRPYEKVGAPYGDLPLVVTKGLFQLKQNPMDVQAPAVADGAPSLAPSPAAASKDEPDTSPTTPDELSAIMARMVNHPRAEEGVELHTAKGRTLAILVSPEKLRSLIAAA